MAEMKRDYLEKSLKQFESHPYPNIPIEESPKDNVKMLYESSLVTARYRRDGTVITDLENRVMLDVACGTGATTLTMALANPGAQIIGVDISPRSIKVARERLNYHGLNNIEFHVVSIEELEKLNKQFDYIYAGDVLYLLPDLASAFRDLAKMLKPDGIIRANLHSQYQRADYYRAQALFRNLGLMDDNPGETELAIVRELYDALKDDVNLKVNTWGTSQGKELSDEKILMNHLFQNDKGYTNAQLVTALETAELRLLDMVDWRDWDWRKLFKDPENLPVYLAMGLEEASLEEQLRFYELIQPNKRLLDFWCGHSQLESREPETWVDKQDDQVIVHLHSCVKTNALYSEITATGTVAPIDLGRYFPFLKTGLWSDRTINSCLFKILWDEPQTLRKLLDCYLAVSPPDIVAQRERNRDIVASIVRQTVSLYEELGIFLLEGRGE